MCIRDRVSTQSTWGQSQQTKSILFINSIMRVLIISVAVLLVASSTLANPFWNQTGVYKVTYNNTAPHCQCQQTGYGLLQRIGDYVAYFAGVTEPCSNLSSLALFANVSSANETTVVFKNPINTALLVFEEDNETNIIHGYDTSALICAFSLTPIAQEKEKNLALYDQIVSTHAERSKFVMAGVRVTDTPNRPWAKSANILGGLFALLSVAFALLMNQILRKSLNIITISIIIKTLFVSCTLNYKLDVAFVCSVTYLHLCEQIYEKGIPLVNFPFISRFCVGALQQLSLIHI
eukprot:TRINITY_DN2330_c0_g2_i1.p1 TRINITY_DN2330_c0_g2~~TRINITY_DN2330_c0_g2_i1.p1  ORF type:complete len:292 (-),score=59.74 TRINITY_DN2330_c0_g2_i1:62-937(-)